MWPGLFCPELSEFGLWDAACSRKEKQIWARSVCRGMMATCLSSVGQLWPQALHEQHLEWYLWVSLRPETQSAGVQSRSQLKDKLWLGPRATDFGWQGQHCVLCPTLGFYILASYILVKFSVVLEFKMSAGLFWGEIYMGRWPPKAVAAMGRSLRSPWFVELLPALALRQLIAPSAAGTAAFLGWTGIPSSSLSPLQSSVLF